MEHMSNADLVIFTARRPARNAILWTEERTTWADLVPRLTTPVRTPETFTEYSSAPDGLRTKIKDVGGFIGARLDGNGARKNDNVRERYLVTLDADNVMDPGFPQTAAQLLQGTAYVIHTTHSHDPGHGKHRYRIIMPLSRPADPEEYEYIIRRLAEDLSLENFDRSCFRKSQLMFWPSASRDGVFDAHEGPGAPLDVDRYVNEERFKDRAAWPGMAAEDARTASNVRTQEDPRKKAGIIGAFCREYSISRALDELLPDVYAPTGKADRYTFAAGSSFGGLVIYQDMFAYSNHATDPAGDGHCHNAYDLVRIHKFGQLDQDFDNSTTHRKRPSMDAMDQWIKDTLPDVYAGVLAEMFPDAEEVLNDFPPDVLERDTDKKGNFVNRLPTYLDILTYDRNLAGLFTRDSFTNLDELTRTPPWRRSATTQEITDADVSQLIGYIAGRYRIEKKELVLTAMDVILENNSHDSARDFFDSLTWDGTPRMETAAIDWLGAADTPATRQMSAKMFLAAVARTYKPGTKFDQVMVLIGPQGCGKSTFAKAMGLGKWYETNVVDMNDAKRTAENIQGRLVVEIGELVGMKKADQENIKSFISSEKDTFRAAYARKTTSRPRRCIFIATTNETEFLRDETGERRYWPIVCDVRPHRLTNASDPQGQLTPEILEYMTQVYAEAVHVYKSGKYSLLLDATAMGELDLIHERHKVEDPFVGMIKDFLDKPVPEDWDTRDAKSRINFFQPFEEDIPGRGVPRWMVCSWEIFEQSDIFRYMTFDKAKNYISKAMQKIDGWARMDKQQRTPYGNQRVWVRTKPARKPEKTRTAAIQAAADEAVEAWLQ